MGTRSMNYIALQPGVSLTTPSVKVAVGKYLNSDTAEIITGVRGTLIVYESNFTPMWARDGQGEHCTHDLEEEIAIHRFLGTLPVESYHMKRAGDEFGSRGAWVDHNFKDCDSVQAIEAAFAKGTQYSPEPASPGAGHICPDCGTIDQVCAC